MTPVGVVDLSRLRPRTAPCSSAPGPRAGSRRPTAASRHVGAYVPPDVARQLRIIAAREDSSTQRLIEEAIEMLFRGARQCAQIGAPRSICQAGSGSGLPSGLGLLQQLRGAMQQGGTGPSQARSGAAGSRLGAAPVGGVQQQPGRRATLPPYGTAPGLPPRQRARRSFWVTGTTFPRSRGAVTGPFTRDSRFVPMAVWSGQQANSTKDGPRRTAPAVDTPGPPARCNS